MKHGLILEKTAFSFLRYSLSLVFLWFGVLKLLNISPVKELVLNSTPAFLSGSPLFFPILAIVEIIIGLGLFMPRYSKIAALAMVGHLIVATLLVFLSSGFDPSFPFLTTNGEFVLKNLVLISAGLLIASKKIK